MNIENLLETFTGVAHIKIFDRYSYKTFRYNDTQKAIDDYGYYGVKSWTIEDNVLKITIQTVYK